MMKLEKAIQKATDAINLAGSSCDVYSILYRYKAIRDLSDSEVDGIYDNIVKTLGF